MIACQIHDYVEIACMYQYEVKLTHNSGTTYQGKAMDTGYDDQRKECIKLETDRGILQLVLDELVRMDAVADNPHFKSVELE